VLGAVGVADTLRADAQRTVERLQVNPNATIYRSICTTVERAPGLTLRVERSQRLGLRVVLMSGDRQSAVDAMAAKVTHSSASQTLPSVALYSDAKSCESQREGFRVGGRSRGRFATPADFPLHDCSPGRGLRVRRWGLGFVHRPRTIFCRPVHYLLRTIRIFCIAVHSLSAST
jgi:hypothetical protein